MLELAEHLKSDRSHVARTLSLVNLALDIVAAVISGNAPENAYVDQSADMQSMQNQIPLLKAIANGI